MSALKSTSRTRPRRRPRRSAAAKDDTAAEGVTPEPQEQPVRTRSPRNEPLLFEVAWEVCNQVGGIYTVLRSKAPSMAEKWGNRYFLIGPYVESSASVEFEPMTPTGAVGETVKQLRELGFGAEYGRWLVTGRPHVVLLRYQDVFAHLHEVKYRLWKDHGIEIPEGDELITNVAAFGELVRLFLVLLAKRESGRRNLVAHFHEWMAGAAVPMLRRNDWPGAIVFTTHATLLGRYLAMNDGEFYTRLPFYNADREARHFNVVPQHSIERAAAHGAHVFTTVSQVTGEECVHLLGRKPDDLLPNGLNIQRFTALHEFQNLHAGYKREIHRFTMGHFFPSYTFDLDKTLYFFTSGRFEFRNKGMDLTIESLARLNYWLQAAGSDITVVAFIITRRPVRSINVNALQTRAMLSEIQTVTDEIKNQIGDRLYAATASGQIPDLNSLVDDYWRLRLRRTLQAWKRDLPPTIVTHDLVDDGKDEVLGALRNCRLFNNAHDRVKVIYHPDFITSSNPLFGLDYDQFVRGCHLGIFPSYYEPWGYTPLESGALGVPAITSDLSGFGDYVVHNMADPANNGMWVIRRKQQTFEQSAQELAQWMYDFCQLNRRDRINLRNKVELYSTHFDWNNLVQHYHRVHSTALSMIEEE